MKFEAEGQEFAKILRSLEQFVRTMKGQINFWYLNAFLSCYRRFLRYDKLEKLEFKLEKKYWDLETCRKSYSQVPNKRVYSLNYLMFSS